MSVEILTMLFFGALLLFVMLGTPLAFALGGISVIFLYAEMGDLGFYLLASKMWETMQEVARVQRLWKPKIGPAPKSGKERKLQQLVTKHSMQIETAMPE